MKVPASGPAVVAEAPILKVTELTVDFGGLRAVSRFSAELRKGELLGIIGPNGAGKTTIFNAITGMYKPTTGSILFNPDGRPVELVGLSPHQISRLGIARTFQNIRLFKELSALENVMIAYLKNINYGVLQGVIHGPAYHREERQAREHAKALLTTLGLVHRANEVAKNLPYGEQRRLEIARALATSPKVLLLDEPGAGMNPQEIKELMGLILAVKEQFELTVILIEHHMDIVMGICRRIMVLDYGETIAEGSPEEIKNDRKVIEAYLGEEVAESA